MFYDFPHIENIKDVLPSIRGEPFFNVIDHITYTTIKYAAGDHTIFLHPDPAVQAMRRECRGLIFDNDTGALLRRPFHKFFNLNQLEETQVARLPFPVPRESVVKKLDGSMVTPFLLRGAVRWATKAGITDTSLAAERFVARHPKYADFAMILLAIGVTPIFEWTSPRNRIVVNYADDNLVLLATRWMKSGHYTPMDEMKRLASLGNIPSVAIMPASGGEVHADELMDHCADLEGEEGYVIRYDKGHMVKVKGDWYLRLHHTLSHSLDPRVLFTLVVNDKTDDLLSRLAGAARADLERYHADFWSRLDHAASLLKDMVLDAMCRFERSEFAASGEYSEYQPAIFQAWGCPDKTRDVIMKMAKSVMGSRHKVRAFSDLYLGGLRPPRLMFGEDGDNG